MSCYNPKLMKCSMDPETGILKYTFCGSASLSDPHEFGSISELSTKGFYYFVVPCGKCLGCRTDYCREWSDRMALELLDHKKALFVTLTYNNENVPFSDNGLMTLSVRDCQLFFKRLRKKFEGVRIRYYLAGEYGSRTSRPHYHGIIYGIGLSDFPDIRLFGNNDLNDPYYTSKEFESIWSNGFVMMSDVNYRTCAYVARYVTKKQYRTTDELSTFGVVPEFNLSSRRPGIGLSHAGELVGSGLSRFSFWFSDGVHEMSLPKSLIRHVLRNITDFSDDVIEFARVLTYDRSMQAYDRLVSNLDWYNLPYHDYLRINSRSAADKFKALPERNVLFNEETKKS